MTVLFAEKDVKKQLKCLAKKAAAFWRVENSKGYYDPTVCEPYIKLPVCFIKEEYLGYDKGRIYEFLWIRFVNASSFEVIKTEFLSAEIYPALDWEYETTLCLTKSWSKALRTCKQYYKKMQKRNNQ
ncbi:hypothetical protein [Legionella sp. 16cNR16C]|uniref:hypothetical protein n=1 Tax=Legionella sp. 16cNR16C TaxID=2905656 RepID=UPI001E4F0051|nr:hypothetical protein [Legionella sp. 16cNR16C]MCE3045365.1 hypothetical protein [Legionella sp. 16cNR16C]